MASLNQNLPTAPGLDREQSMTSILGIPGTDYPGTQTISRQIGPNSGLQQSTTFNNETRELSSMYISKSLISIFCFLNPGGLKQYFNNLKTRISTRTITNKYCNINKTSLQQRKINNLLQSPVKTPLYMYCLLINILKSEGYGGMSPLQAHADSLGFPHNPSQCDTFLWEFMVQTNLYRTPLIRDIFKSRRYPTRGEMGGWIAANERTFGHIYTHDFRHNQVIHNLALEIILGYISIQNDYNKLFDLAPRPTTPLIVYRNWGTLAGENFLKGEFLFNSETSVTLLHSYASLTWAGQSTEERQASNPKFPNEQGVTTLIRIKEGSHGIINLSIPDQEANSEISNVTGFDENIAVLKKQQFELILDPRGALFPTYRKVEPESLSSTTDNRVSYDEFIYEPIPILTSNTVYNSRVFDKPFVTLRDESGDILKAGNAHKATWGFLYYKPLGESLCEQGNYSEAIFENFGIGFFQDENNNFVRGQIIKKESSKWYVKPLRWQIPDAALEEMYKQLDIYRSRPNFIGPSTLDDVLTTLGRDDPMRRPRPHGGWVRSALAKIFEEDSDLRNPPLHNGYTFEEMNQRVAQLPTRNIENTLLVFNEEKLIQFEDYERLEEPGTGVVCFQKKMSAIYNYPYTSIDELRDRKVKLDKFYYDNRNSIPTNTSAYSQGRWRPAISRALRLKFYNYLRNNGILVNYRGETFEDHTQTAPNSSALSAGPPISTAASQQTSAAPRRVKFSRKFPYVKVAGKKIKTRKMKKKHTKIKKKGRKNKNTQGKK